MTLMDKPRSYKIFYIKPMKKTIIFDVDWVITDSWTRKDEIIEEVLLWHWLLHLPWVRQILDKWLNRILILQEINKIKRIDQELILTDINNSLIGLESSIVLIQDTIDFIKKNYATYNFFTNTSMPKTKLIRIFWEMNIWKYFLELLAYDDGSKKENIEYVMQVHDAKSEDILFIDDKQTHLDAVKSTGVKSLLFRQDWVSLEEKITAIFS